MATRTFHVQVGDQVFLEEGGEEIGAVRRVAKDHIVIYIEGAGDFTLNGPEIAAAHDGKLRLDPAKLEPSLLAAARGGGAQVGSPAGTAIVNFDGSIARFTVRSCHSTLRSACWRLGVVN